MAAVTLDVYLPFDSGAGASVSEAGWREMMKHMLGSASGVIRGFGNDFATIGDSSGMQVKTNTGECFMRGHYGSNASQETLSIASNGSGNPRIDIVVLRVHFANNNIVIDVVQGTPAASPTAPNVTQNTTMWETKLADVAVAAGAVTITAANVTDRRTYTTANARYSRTTSQSIPTVTNTDVVFNSVEFAGGEIVANSVSSPSTFTLNRAGIWVVTGFAAFSPLASGGRRLSLLNSGTPLVSSDVPSMGGTDNTNVIVTTTEKFSAGAVVKMQAWQNGAGAPSLVAGTAALSLVWIGP